jgi:ribonuclease HII
MPRRAGGGAHGATDERECALRLRGFARIAGVDEAGCGALAGPVVAAAVILPDGDLPLRPADSKTLRPEQRDNLYEIITAHALAWAVGVVASDVIDAQNILRATHLAMRTALLGIDPLAEYALIDGRPVRGIELPHETIVDGDHSNLSIAAASIVAKVTRDRLMVAFAAEYPEYGFAQHKGYGTAEHCAALRLHGPCPIHRRSFAPVRLGEQLTLDEPQG